MLRGDHLGWGDTEVVGGTGGRACVMECEAVWDPQERCRVGGLILRDPLPVRACVCVYAHITGAAQRIRGSV